MYKKAWCTCKVVVLPCQAIAFFTFSSPPHLKLPIIYDTLWSVRNRIFSVQIELLLLIASETFFYSSLVPSFLVRKVENESFPCTHKLGERTGQLWRDNSRRVRTQEKNSGETVRRLGTIIIQSIFCAQSIASIRLTVWKWSGESRYPGAFTPVLENFCRAFSRLTAPLNLTTYGVRGLTTTNFPFTFWNWIKSLRIQLQEKSPAFGILSGSK